MDPWGLCWEIAGAVGVDPGRLTLGELITMYRGRRKAELERAMTLIATFCKALTGEGTEPPDNRGFEEAFKSAFCT